MAVTYGLDPEFFCIDRENNYLSAIPIVKANKDNKIDLGNGHQMFYDNVLLELNVATAMSEDDLIAKLTDCFGKVLYRIRPYRILPQASHTLPKQQCLHQDAKVFGCQEEYDAYDMVQLNPPLCEAGNCFRSAGGHIHLGATKTSYPLLAEDKYERDWGRVWVVRMLDLFVGLPSLLVDHDPTSAARRKLYGRAGTHRPKEEYGVEYRATSNFWLQSPLLARLIYRLSIFTVQFVAAKGHLELWKDESECKGYDVQLLRKTIDESDIPTAKRLMEDVVKKYLPNDLYTTVFRLSEPQQYNFSHEWSL